MKRKYWIGVSGVDDHKPEDFITFEVFDEDQLIDAQHDAVEYIANDYLGDFIGEEDDRDDN